MESVTRETPRLRDALKNQVEPDAEFKECWFHSTVGDFLAVYLSEEDAFSERVDDVLTVYRSKATDEIVGCKIKGISLLAVNVVNIFTIEDQEITLQLLLLNAAAINPELNRHYWQLAKKVEQIRISKQEIKRWVSESNITASAA